MNADRIVVDTNILFLDFDGRLWSSDDQLKAGLRAKGFDRFFEP